MVRLTFSQRMSAYRLALRYTRLALQDTAKAATRALVAHYVRPPAAPAARPSPSAGLIDAPQFAAISEPGFGDPWNTTPWSMQWWRGRLYVGTSRALPCVEYATFHRAVPLQRYPPRFDPDASTAPPVDELPLQAEIWRYTPEDGRWERMFQSPADVPIPGKPGRFVARDIGFRDLALVRETDGTEALYVSGVSSRSIHPGVPSPRLLRTTDGRDFRAVVTDVDGLVRDLDVVGFRTMQAYDGRFFVTGGTLYGDGVLLESADPSTGRFRRATPEGMRVFEMAVFNGWLYLGLRSWFDGYSVYKTDARGEPPYRFVPVVTRGAGRRGAQMGSVISMRVFRDMLYVGSDSPTELIRIHPDDTWDLVVGRPRRTPTGVKRPLSGMGDGFDWPLNRTVQRMQDHGGWLYVGTYNLTGKLRNMPLVSRAVWPRRGFDLYATDDGAHFRTITRDGFDSPMGGSVRTFASTPHGLFLGAVYESRGAVVYLGRQG